jgi:hypothetical protein
MVHRHRALFDFGRVTFQRDNAVPVAADIRPEIRPAFGEIGGGCEKPLWSIRASKYYVCTATLFA